MNTDIKTENSYIFSYYKVSECEIIDFSEKDFMSPAKPKIEEKQFKTNKTSLFVGGEFKEITKSTNNLYNSIQNVQKVETSISKKYMTKVNVTTLKRSVHLSVNLPKKNLTMTNYTSRIKQLLNKK